ncbi:plasmid partitioning protein RepB [Cohaesibacter gelatinilyticus]|mgnify:CR=1 FL=1|jgi:ParB family chromosome partitioning protein|uniref:Chromosome partitioning protein, ParB family n=1 Tax=Cohaesibacter gelatinilyticus TaxID=372072 RepID=A0A285PI86_9HYPH|nr:plasmid partitioning protein RepB [Cohaesibacter gelatinilyticus]SNZ21435.1 chromosome partitioning protein, ParB family [Cohaesibacter gelatinilyticus]
MARKNLLASITGGATDQGVNPKRAKYVKRGASRSMVSTIEEMAENSKKMMEGEAIVSLNPDLIDASFIADRLETDPQAFEELKQAIAEHGQSTPILVRPHPDDEGRYMVVYGHRRARAAKELEIEVRAVVKSLNDIAHIITQGQENTARSDLTFIEKALFARKLSDMEQSKDVIQAALTIDATLLSRMQSITDIIPSELLDALGSARGIGRDRWEDLKRLVTNPKQRDVALGLLEDEAFMQAEVREQFEMLFAKLGKDKNKVAKSALGPKGRMSNVAKKQLPGWSAKDEKVSASYKASAKSFNLTLKKEDAKGFGNFITAHLERLYEEYRQELEKDEKRK